MNIEVLSDKRMREVGFTDFIKTTWYYSTILDKNISFNVSINKKNPSHFSIDVLDEDFLQPYDYQYILERNPNHAFALKVKEQVEKQMFRLAEHGIVNDYKYGDYI